MSEPTGSDVRTADPAHRHSTTTGGADPAGTALLRPVLRRCDREGLPAYLEASSPDNARLYRRLGFVTRATVRPLGSPPLELMTRPPGATAG
jgi:hypothetical protein